MIVPFFYSQMRTALIIRCLESTRHLRTTYRGVGNAIPIYIPYVCVTYCNFIGRYLGGISVKKITSVFVVE